MEANTVLLDARRAAGLTQAALAARAGTSQATLSAYETGCKQPSLATFSRLLAAAGARLVVQRGAPLREPSSAELLRAGRGLEEVLALAEALPVRHRPRSAFPPLRPRP